MGHPLPRSSGTFAQQAADKEVGVAFFLDEAQRFDFDALEAIGNALSEANSEGLPTIGYWAGLPGTDQDIQEAITSANRFRYNELGPLSVADNERAIVEPFRESDISVDPRVRPELWSMSQGYPYLTQVYGYSLWNVADTAKGLSAVDIPSARAAAYSHLRSGSEQRNAWDSLTEMEQRYVAALAQAGTEARTRDVAAAMDKDQPSDVSAFRAKLIEKQVIDDPGRGWVRLQYPLTRDFVLGIGAEHWISRSVNN